MKVEFALLLLVALVPRALAAELNVGPGQPFADIASAVEKAAPGDTISVYPLPDGRPYEKVVLQLRKRLTIRSYKTGVVIPLNGTGYDYSGDGKVPRAIVQFDSGSDGSVLSGFELSGAHNKSFNGAGVRINQANSVRVEHCDIHDNDMGIMSNGRFSATPPTGADQLIANCRIYHNGAIGDPGYNHNLYLGGTSVTLMDSEVFGSLTGQNVKSRAHITRVVDCYIHDANSREIEFVDEAGNTDVPGSDALVLGCVIVKSPNNEGNRNVIHFGQDVGHDRNGTLYLVHDTIVTPYLTPVIDLSAPHVKVHLVDNLIWDAGSGQKNQALLRNRTGGNSPGLITGLANFFCGGFGPQGDLGLSVPSSEPPPLVALNSPQRDPAAYELAKSDPRVSGKAVPDEQAGVPAELWDGLGIRHDKSDIGAGPSAGR